MSGEIACHSCDLLLDVGAIKEGESASCPRCGCFLTRYRADAYNRVLAFASAGLIFLVLANSYPFLSFSSTGLESIMTLRQTPGALWDNGMPEVAVLVAAFIIFIPAAVLLMMVISLISHRLGLETGLSVALFPMVIIAMTIERMSVVWEERGATDAIREGLGSLLVAVAAYIFMGLSWLEHLIFTFPELLLVVLALVVLAGRYTGYRLLELRRFKALVDK